MGVIVDSGVLPGLLLLAAELAVLAAVGFVVVRVALRQEDELSALAQGLAVGPALWGIIVNFVMYVVPGLAGAAVGWGVIIVLGAALVWRSPDRLCPSAHQVAGFAGAVLALGWAALASRQFLGSANPHTDLGLAASIRFSGFPVTLPWHAETPAAYHYGASLLTGLLTPPTGPDLAFGWELVGVYAWVSFVLVVVTALRQRGSWPTALLLAPLMLSYGLHTFVWVDPSKVEGVVQLAVPAGLPTAGVRTSVANIYWPSVELSGDRLGSLPDIWKPAFTLGYALTFVVLAHVARSDHASWLGSLTLAGLVGFLGLLVTTLAPLVLVLWASVEVLRLARVRPRARLAMRSGLGLALAGLLLAFGGGLLSGLVGGGAGPSGLAWTRSLNADHWQVLGAFNLWPGGVGLLSMGPLAVAGAAVALARRDRLVLTLAVGSALLSLAWLSLEYPPFPKDVDRLAGHARTLGLAALLLALSARLARGRSTRWRCAAGALLAGLVVWPTAVAPAHSWGDALDSGVQWANARWMRPPATEQGEAGTPRRERLPEMSSRLAAYIRNQTAVDARVLAGVVTRGPTDRSNLTVLLNTGRPNNQGFTSVTHLTHEWGPNYWDALRYLEPAPFRRLGLTYVYATDAWVAELPARAQRRLADTRLFDLLARDGDEAIYRVRSAFLALESTPHPASFEALRAVPPGTVIYLPPQPDLGNGMRLLRVASVLPHLRLVGAINPRPLHLRTPAPWVVEPLGAHTPELVALPRFHAPWQFPPATWREVWRNPRIGVAVYAPNAAGALTADVGPPPARVRLADVQADETRLTFTATLDARAPRSWTGQDWVLVPIDASPWGLPTLGGFGHPKIAQWFAGQAAAGAERTTHTYLFDAHASSLSVRGGDGDFATVEGSTRTPSPGAWMLALRLNRWTAQGVNETAYIVPVLRIQVSDAGTVSYQVYDAARGWQAP